MSLGFSPPNLYFSHRSIITRAAGDGGVECKNLDCAWETPGAKRISEEPEADVVPPHFPYNHL